jgi:hypothetical protein
MAREGESHVPVRLYRIFNIEQSRHGEPFAMCDGCFKVWEEAVRGRGLLVTKIADGALVPCGRSGVETQEAPQQGT